MVKRVLILVPDAPGLAVAARSCSRSSAWSSPFRRGRAQADRPDYWAEHDRVLASLAFAKSRKRAEAVAAVPWDLVIVDEAHHCKNRATQNWQLVNALKRRHLFLLTATPVQNNLLELYNLLTLLEPGHLKTEIDFKRQYVRRGNPRDPRNRERLRSLLGEVMIRNTRSLVQMDLPPRYAQTMLAEPHGDEARALPTARRLPAEPQGAAGPAGGRATPKSASEESTCRRRGRAAAMRHGGRRDDLPPLGRRQLAALLTGRRAAIRGPWRSRWRTSPATTRRPRPIIELAGRVDRTAKDERLLELLRQSRGEKMLVFATFRRTLEHLQQLLAERRASPSSRSPAPNRSARRTPPSRPSASRCRSCSARVGRRGAQPPVRQHAGQLRPAVEPDADRAARGPHPPHRPDPRRVHLQPLHGRLAGGPHPATCSTRRSACSSWSWARWARSSATCKAARNSSRWCSTSGSARTTTASWRTRSTRWASRSWTPRRSTCRRRNSTRPCSARTTMSDAVQEELHAFAAELIEQSGGLVEWPAGATGVKPC